MSGECDDPGCEICAELYGSGQAPEGLQMSAECETCGADLAYDLSCQRCEDKARIAVLEQWVDDLQNGMYINCVYCGYRYGPDDGAGGQTMRKALEAHIATCPSHPLSQERKQVEQLDKELRSYRLSLSPELGEQVLALREQLVHLEMCVVCKSGTPQGPSTCWCYNEAQVEGDGGWTGRFLVSLYGSCIFGPSRWESR